MKNCRIRRIFVLLLMVSMLAIMPGYGNSSNNAQAAPLQASEPVTLELITWINEPTLKAIDALNARFKEIYPNVTIHVTAVPNGEYNQLVQTRIMAGDVDIITHQYFSPNPPYTFGLPDPAFMQYITGGDILDLTDQPFIKNWDPGMIKEAGSIDGKVHSICIGQLGQNFLFYNKTMFDQYNLEAPTTWAEFVNVCETLKSNGIAPITLGAKDSWPIRMYGYSMLEAIAPDTYKDFIEGIWTGEAKFNDATGLEVLERYNTFCSYLEEGVLGVDDASATGRFVAGKAAMLGEGTWGEAQIAAANPDFEYGYFILPGDKAPAQLHGKYDLMFSIYGKTEKAEACLKYLDTLSQLDVYAEFVNSVGFLPTMPGVSLTNSFLGQINDLVEANGFDTSFNVLVRQPAGAGKYVLRYWDPTYLQVLGGDFTPAEYADLMQNDWDAAIEAAKSAK